MGFTEFDEEDEGLEEALTQSEEWAKADDLYEGFTLLMEEQQAVFERMAVTPSQFTEFAFRMPDYGGGYAPFSFEGRRHLRHVYDTKARRIQLFCSRQTEKSTTLGNLAITYSCLIPSFKTLYVSPSATQTKTFSMDRIKEPIETSEILRAYLANALQQNILEKQFVNRSKITLRYAFLNADRTRGIPTLRIFIDEMQDILSDSIPVIEQCSSHAPEALRNFIYAGTPKGLDNVIEFYRSGTSRGIPMSTMGEWVVPCDAHGGETGRYWNILGEKNIQRAGLSCEACGKRINPRHADAQWAIQQRDGIYESYRITQLMVPWLSWSDLFLDYTRYGRDKFYNEVLGLSYDSGMRPLTRLQLQACCNPEVSMHPDTLETYKAVSLSSPIFAGIDWGGGGDRNQSYTVLTLGTYIGDKFRIIYAHRFVGQDLDPEPQLQKIEEMLSYFNVRLIGADYGGGLHPNDRLTRKFGPRRLLRFQYMPRGKKRIFWNTNFRRYQAVRTEVMSDLFNAIKRKQIELPSWAEFEDPYGVDCLNIYSEYNETLRMTQYDHRPDRPDDTFHSILYCFLAACHLRPRPDVFAPSREDPSRGPVSNGNTGPIEQQ